MRPKKRILLIDEDETRTSILRLVLQVWGYKVFTSASAAYARKRSFGRLDFVIARWPVKETWVGVLADANDCPYLILSDKDSKSIVTDVVLIGSDCSAANILQAVKSGTVRKRGPRKGSSKCAVALPPKKPPVSVTTISFDPRRAELTQLEQDRQWLIGIADSFTLGSQDRLRSERILAHIERVRRFIRANVERAA
jgi:two-component system, OmpR family, response regulator CpxR